MKNLSAKLIEQQLRSGTKEEDLEPELLELLDEMDNVARAKPAKFSGNGRLVE
ncbi:hypothetical protein LQQ61_00325 (plasmid) [Escherichia coli]|nr:hypothetical protein LQQ61_00325 [Escherichia coli]